MITPIISQYAGFFLWGAAVTIWLSWIALVFGAILGAIVGMARTSRWTMLRVGALVYTELFRSIPILILLFFVYYGLPLVMRVTLSGFAAATVALTLDASSYMAEVVRAGIESVGRGQWEAAFSSGLRFRQVMYHVVGPQAIRVMLPPSVGVYVTTLKDSSLAAVIGYVELTQAGLLVRSTTGNSFGVLAIVACLYFVINYTISLGGAVMERRFRIA